MKANVKYTGLDVANRIRFDAEATFKQGATFTPTITPEGVLSWSNNGGLENPLTVNLRGPQGERGEQGEQGVQGIQGIPGVNGAPGTTDYLQLTNRPSLVSLERNTAYAVGDVFYYDGIGVLTKDALNAADTWKVNNGNLIIDACKTAIDKITVGSTALNYTGNGFKYVFDNGKNALADIEIHTVESATDSSDKAASTKFVQAAIVAALAAKGL